MGITTSDGSATRNIKHSSLRFQTNDVVLVDGQTNPIGSRVFGPVTRDLRAKNYNKVISQSKRML
jgi:large subunit ribosomal protein L14